MHYALSGFDSIDESTLERLAAAGVGDADNLLQQAALPEPRERLSNRTSIPPDTLFQLAGLADLVRVKGIGPATAELFVHSGCVLSVQGLLKALHIDSGDPFKGPERIADQPQVKAAAKDLRLKLKDCCDQDGVRRRLPTLRELTQMGEEAAELRPRLVRDSGNDQSIFRERIKREARDTLKLSLKSDMRTVGILGLVMLLMVVVGFLLTTFVVRTEFGVVRGPVDEIGLAVAKTIKWYTVDTYAGVGFTLILLAIPSFTLLTYATNLPLALFLFSPSPYQRYYKRRLKDRHDRDKRVLAIGTGIIGVIGLSALAAVLLIAFDSLQFTSSLNDETFFTLLVLGAGILGLCSAVAASMPTLVFYWRHMRHTTVAERTGFQRALVYDIATIVRALLVIGVFARFLLPWTFQIGESIDRNVWKARAVDQFRAHMADLDALELSDSPEREEARDRLIIYISALVDDYSDEQDSVIGFLDTLLPLFMQSIVWTLLLTFLLVFVLPYLLAGGWQRGAFYIFLLVATFFIEGVIQRAAPAWLLLEAGSTGATLMVIVAIFANALLVDWVYDTLAEPRTVCPGCHAELDANVSFCPHCGLVQA
jgi:hypothetical protein